MSKKKNRTISIILFIVGVFIALIFTGSILWANFELPFYFDYSYASVRTENQGRIDLNCPIFLTTNETGTVSTVITNTTDKTLNPTFRGEISYWGGIVREVEFKPTILPGESSPITIDVNSDDIVFKFMIMVRAFQLPTYKTPAQAGSCAIVMVPIPFLNGTQVYTISLFLILFFLGGGILLWVKTNRPLKGLSRKVFHVMVFMAILFLTTIVLGIIDGFIIIALLLLVLIVLLILVAVVYFSMSPPDDEY